MIVQYNFLIIKNKGLTNGKTIYQICRLVHCVRAWLLCYTLAFIIEEDSGGDEMRNQIGFIPKSYKLQPDYYGKFFNNWAAIFLTKDGQEFHIELQGSFYNKEEAKHIEILKQNSTNRTVIFRDIKSIKQAVETLSNYFQKIGVLI